MRLPIPQMDMMDYDVKFLAHCTAQIPVLATLWFNELGKQWIPNASIAKAIENYQTHTNIHQLPLTLVAFFRDKPIAMASLRENDGIRPDLTPWLGSVIVHPAYRRKKIGEQLINLIKHQARHMAYKKLYLFTLDLTIHQWYEKLGFSCIGTDKLYHHPVNVMEIVL